MFSSMPATANVSHAVSASITALDLFPCFRYNYSHFVRYTTPVFQQCIYSTCCTVTVLMEKSASVAVV